MRRGVGVTTASTLVRGATHHVPRDAYHPRMPLLTAADPTAGQGFSFTNLLILIVILAVLWPLMRWVRRRVSKRRRERWAQEEDAGAYFTEENDPDLRRNHPES